MPRSNWKGYISFGLVNIPIVLYPVENTSEKITFHQIDRRNNARIKYKRVNVETGKEVPWEEIVQGYEFDKDNILVMEKGELEKVAGENARTIAIESFVNTNDIHFIDVQKTYCLVPDKKGEKGYVILREALKKTNKIGIAKVIISTKEYVAAVAVYENALMLYLLHYYNEIRPLSEFDIPTENIEQYKVTKKEIDISKQLISSMSRKWKPQSYKDEYKQAVHKWATEKAKKIPHTIMKPRARIKAGKEINFVELLKKSLESSKPAKPSKKELLRPRIKSHAAKHITRH